MKRVQTVGQYIATAPQEVQEKLKKLRAAIKEVAPNALEKISYGMPNYGSYKLGWVSFANFKNHISLFITPDVLDNFTSEIKMLRTGRATLRFPLDENLPMTLIKRVVTAAINNSFGE